MSKFDYDLPRRRKRDVAMLTVAAMGVVYGDIGTSPLYTLSTCFAGRAPLSLDLPNIFGILSLIFWSLIVVVTLKYVVFILRADNNGEGGVLALLALTKRVPLHSSYAKFGLVFAGIFGASLFLGDGMITPAISVISAVEGMEIVAPTLEHYVVPITLTVITILFLVQSKGTAKIGAAFGPVMFLWFGALAIMGWHSIAQTPQIIQALNPYYAFRFLYEHGLYSMAILGNVVLAVTGGEALYADMGHFGRRPIRIAWLCFVLPALVINYFGQGALLLRNPGAIDNPFYRLAPETLLWPLLILSTAATVIASQAVISGVFSITREAVQLQYWPRVRILHTSNKEEGQIYVPSMNWFLLFAVILLVIGFKSSANLAAAYGIAVTGTMTVSTILVLVVARGLWRWPMWKVALMGTGLLIVDNAFFLSNLLKFFEGGWFPLLIGILLLSLMFTWHAGRKMLTRRLGQSTMPVATFVESLQSYRPVVVPGTAIYMSSTSGRIPYALLHNIRHNKIMHKRNVFLTVFTDKVPHVPFERRVEVEDVGEGFFIVSAWFGFQESPDIEELQRACAQHGLDMHESDTSYFITRDRLIITDEKALAPVFRQLFMFLHRNAASATDYFNIPTNRVVEIGVQVEI